MLKHVCDICLTIIEHYDDYVVIEILRASSKKPKIYNIDTGVGEFSTNEKGPYEICDGCFGKIKIRVVK